MFEEVRCRPKFFKKVSGVHSSERDENEINSAISFLKEILLATRPEKTNLKHQKSLQKLEITKNDPEFPSFPNKSGMATRAESPKETYSRNQELDMVLNASGANIKKTQKLQFGQHHSKSNYSSPAQKLPQSQMAPQSASKLQFGNFFKNDKPVFLDESYNMSFPKPESKLGTLVTRTGAQTGGGGLAIKIRSENPEMTYSPQFYGSSLDKQRNGSFSMPHESVLLSERNTGSYDSRKDSGLSGELNKGTASPRSHYSSSFSLDKPL